MTAEVTMLVGSVFPGPQGGAVFSGKDPCGVPVRAVADGAHIHRCPQRGETWRLRGTIARHPGYGDQLHVEDARLLKPDDRVIANYLSHHPAFRGIGIGAAKVARLCKEFGAELAPLLEQGAVEKLSVVLGGECAGSLIARWRENARESAVVEFLAALGADVRLVTNVLRYWPDRTVEKLRENPYRLLFLVGWPATDKIAGALGVGAEDDRRLIAAVESVAYARLHAGKHTRVEASALRQGILDLIRLPDPGAARNAIDLALADGSVVGSEEDGYQVFGCAVMEKYLTTRFRDLLSPGHPKTGQDSAATPVRGIVLSFEQAGGVTLNAEQRSAVHMAVSHRLSVLKGGAGVGKTTVLQAVCAVVEARNGRVIPMALAGRAAQRIREATGRDAFTITTVLNQIKRGRLVLGDDDLVVIDESSMLDLILVYRLMRVLPQRVRLLLVGDPFQLPPIGPGLVFPVLAGSDAVPQQELTQVHRQTAGSRIPALAQEIRFGHVPQFDAFTGPAQGVSFLETASQHLSQTVIDVRRSLIDSGEVQILGVTRRGEAGVETLNAAIHKLIAGRQRTLPGWAFAETEPVMHLENDYDRDLFNGSLGRVRRVLSDRSEAGALVHALECDFDGGVHRFEKGSLDRLEIAHAITVHKAQGSQFQRVIIPVLPSQLLDRTLIYTALTRAVDQVVFIGDRVALSNAIAAPPRSQMRQVGFRF